MLTFALLAACLGHISTILWLLAVHSLLVNLALESGISAHVNRKSEVLA